MSDGIEKAARDAVEAADNTKLTKQIAAILAAQQLLAQQQVPATAASVRTEFDARKWLVLGGLGIAAGLVASLLAVAVAIGAVAVAILALVLRALWRDFQKGK